MGAVTPVYEREGVSLYEGDCREVLPALGEGIADVLITDPPYGIVNRFGSVCTYKAKSGNQGRRSLQFDYDTPEVTASVIEAITLALRTIKRPGSAFIFCGFDQTGEMLPVMRKADLTVKPAAWVKSCPPPVLPGGWWPSAFELAFYGYHSGAWFGDTDPKRSNVFHGDSLRHGQPGRTGHPTQKPLWLMKRIVQALCPPGGTVLDPFGGSGTTAIACVKTGRRCILIEREPRYVAIAKRRLERAETPLFANLAS